MDKVDNFIRRFIISSVNTIGFAYLSDDAIFITDMLDKYFEKIATDNDNPKATLPRKTSERIPFLKYLIENFKDDDNINENDAKDVIIVLEYQLFLDEKKYDNRFKKQVRDLIISRIKKKFKSLKLIKEKYLFNPKKLELNFIESLSDFIKFNSTNFSKYDNVFYRGHSNINWQALPSIYRNNWFKNEHKMFREIIIRNSEEFVNTKSTFEKLTIMQHYGLPTRLLDITKNPMVALYFACCDKAETNNAGEILIFVPEESSIKYYDSDTVSMLANLSKCERGLETNKSKKDFNTSYDQGLKLLHLIKEEKPYFLNVMNPNDFNQALVVRPINNNARIKKQFGYFFLFGINEKIDKPAEITSQYKKGNLQVRYFIDENDKPQILKDLEGLGINGETLFPEIENGTLYLRSKY